MDETSDHRIEVDHDSGDGQTTRLAAAREMLEIGAPVDDWPVMKAQICAAYSSAVDDTSPSSEARAAQPAPRAAPLSSTRAR